MTRIVVIHAGAIGDLVQTLPALAAVRAARPGATVTLIGRPERAVLARLAGAADACADLETSGLWRVAQGRPDGCPALAMLAEADLVLDFLTRGALAAALPQVVTLDPLPPEGWADTAAAWIGGQVAERLGIAAPPHAPEITLPEPAIATARARLDGRGLGEPVLAIHPGSGSAKKNWPAARFAAVAARAQAELGLHIAWLAGPAELERGTMPAEALAAGAAVFADLALDEVAALLALADAYLGNDSGITQVAAAVRRTDGRATPVVALFGPTDARVWGPRGRHVSVVRSADGRMDGIAADEVWAALRTVVGAGTA
ncbi:MAG: hypothetical protein IMZ66_06950 [Planctomycetes bacterium]|nr:hypothetical protein [Planctomycetota bacterium]